jgi:hypothetical protein
VVQFRDGDDAEVDGRCDYGSSGAFGASGSSVKYFWANQLKAINMGLSSSRDDKEGSLDLFKR